MRHSIALAVLTAVLSGAAFAAYELPTRKLEAAVSGSKYQDLILPPELARASSDRFATVQTQTGASLSVASRVAPVAIALR